MPPTLTAPPSADQSERVSVPLPESVLVRDAYRRVYAATLIAPASAEVVARIAGLELKGTLRILRALQRAGLLLQDDGVWHADLDRVTLSVESEPVVRTTVKPIPRKQSQRLAFLYEAVALFELGIEYREPDVNTLLKQLNPDFAAVRRYLVEEGLMSRSDGIYRRIQQSST